MPSEVPAAAEPASTLAELPAGQGAFVRSLSGEGAAGVGAATLRRLAELGFLPGEPVTVVQRGPGGREPLAVRVGETMFALRLVEARCVRITPV